MKTYVLQAMVYVWIAAYRLDLFTHRWETRQKPKNLTVTPITHMEHFVSCVYNLKGCSASSCHPKETSHGVSQRMHKGSFEEGTEPLIRCIGLFSPLRQHSGGLWELMGKWRQAFLLHHEDRNIWHWKHSAGNLIVLPCPELKAKEDSSSAINRSRVRLFKGWVIPQDQDSWHLRSWLAINTVSGIRHHQH